MLPVLSTSPGTPSVVVGPEKDSVSNRTFLGLPLLYICAVWGEGGCHTLGHRNVALQPDREPTSVFLSSSGETKGVGITVLFGLVLGEFQGSTGQATHDLQRWSPTPYFLLTCSVTSLEQSSNSCGSFSDEFWTMDTL